MKKHTWTIVGVIAVVLLVGSVVLSNQASQKANEGIEFSTHIKGNPEAAVVLAKYSDFQCPACAQAAPVVDAALEQYGDSIRFEYNHFPLTTIHPYALSAARAAEAAGQQGQFFAMHDLLFENQQTWSNSSNPQAFFIQYAEEIGLDVATFKRHLGASVIRDKVMDEFAEARSLGFTGTPTFTLNGTRMQFASYEDFLSQIEVAIGVASGTPAAVPATTGQDVRFGL